jgi:hypothetical protein
MFASEDGEASMEIWSYHAILSDSEARVASSSSTCAAPMYGIRYKV